MRIARTIWKHEVEQADEIVHSLLERKSEQSRWKQILLPLLLLDYMRFRRKHKITRKNLLFTKQLAFEAAKEIFQGGSRAEEIRFIEIRTKKILEKEEKGFYTEKVRRKQLYEVELLIDHYLGLLRSTETRYPEMIRESYQSSKNYRTFLRKLQQAEEEVIQATLATMRKGSKKERVSWFNSVKQASQKVRMEEAERIFVGE